jgi:hypothetical protein
MQGALQTVSDGRAASLAKHRVRRGASSRWDDVPFRHLGDRAPDSKRLGGH